MVKYRTMDANEAVSLVSYKFSEMCGIYPITPASPMAEGVDDLAGKGYKNYWGNIVDVIEMQSEAGAVALVHGALQSGILSTTFTASQGLLLMIPTLYKMAGEMLPGVVHVAARSLATHALSIFGDHQDVYSVRGTGVCMLCSNNPKEAYHMAGISHISAINASLPFVHFFDGFRTSHEIQKIEIIDIDKLYDFINLDKLNEFRNKGMNSNKPTTRGTAENDDVYFQHMESRNKNYGDAVNEVVDAMNKFNEFNGTDYKPFNYYGDKDATDVIVAMGSVCDTIKEVVDYLNSNGNKVGMISVHLYRPFSVKHLCDVLPSTVKSVAVLDRAKDIAANGEPLYLDVVEALRDKSIKVVGGRYGLSSKNTTSAQIKAVFDMMDSNKLSHNFTIGINDDVTNLSLNIDNNFKLSSNCYEILIYGYGSDGMVSTSKDLIKIIGNNTDNFVQGYFQYDSKKSGGVTRSHIRISKNEILKPYYVDNPSLIVVSKDSYMYKYDILDNINDSSILLLNTNLTKDELVKSLPNKVKYMLAKKNVSLYVIDAYKLVNEFGLKNKISTCMERCIFELINIIESSEVLDIMRESNERRFLKKGQDIVDINNKVIESSIEWLEKVTIDNNWENLGYEDKKVDDFSHVIGSLKGDSLPVSAFLDKKDGIFTGGNTKYEKRDIAENVPCWNPVNCIQCNQCAFVCPHAVIRSYLVDSNDGNVNGCDSIFPKGYKYSIGVSYKDCTGCGLCSKVCPGKLGKTAIEMKNYDRDIFKQDDFDYLEGNNLNNSYKNKIKNVKNIGFMEPKFEFSGSCAGCGETAYLKNLTQFFGDNLFIANATGCSSIYGASVPSFPYSVAWANSLFEDNAEFGLGIYKGIELKREKIRKFMELNKDKEEYFEKWLNNIDNYEICREVYDNLDFSKYDELGELKDFIIPKSMWIVGGDGFAYDIGYSGIDHVLSRNDNVNILVLDTEVYSNTGGQSSKSSQIGSIGKFASKGKNNYKKDLARIAMCYPGCYVACVNIGYDKEHYLKVLKEASEHKGPSIVIAYSPCIEHGIKNGMEHSLDDAKLATECGYFLTFRYKPSEEKFYLDSKNVDFSKYEEFLMNENRYINLKRVNENEASELLENQKEWSIKRFNYYNRLDISNNI